MHWRVIQSGKMHPQEIMQKDVSLLEQLQFETQSILHLYEWDRDCLTYGYFTDPLKYLKAEGLKKHGICMARRPTGGGIIFHVSDYAFSILIPASSPHFSLNTLENYAYVNGWVAQAISPLLKDKPVELLQAKAPCEAICSSFCMANPTQFDIVCKGKKIGGAAQRRTKYGLLHQGSISLALPPEALLKDLLEDQALASMKEVTHCLLGFDRTNEQLTQLRREMKLLLKKKHQLQLFIK